MFIIPCRWFQLLSTLNIFITFTLSLRTIFVLLSFARVPYMFFFPDQNILCMPSTNVKGTISPVVSVPGITGSAYLFRALFPR
jgi:hypothetical protein